MSIALTDINGNIIKGNSAANALNVINYNSNGLTQEASTSTIGTTQSPLVSGQDYKVSRLLHASSEGTLRSGKEVILFNDVVDVLNSNNISRWQPSNTTSSAVGTGALITISNGPNGGMRISNRKFPLIDRCGLIYKSQARITDHTANSVIELGFGFVGGTNTIMVNDGIFWRQTSSGYWTPVISYGLINNAIIEIHGTPISNDIIIASIPSTDYGIYTVYVEDTKAVFTIATMSGTIVNEQVVEFSPDIGTFGSSHLNIFERLYNSNNASTQFSQSIFLCHTSVNLINFGGYNIQQSLIGNGNANSRDIALGTTTSNSGNSSAPANATLSNTTAAYATQGGPWKFAAVAGSETDYALFGVKPAGTTQFSMIVTRISISSYNTGAANGAGLTVLQWSAAFNSTGGSLVTAAPTNPMRTTIGAHVFGSAAPIGASGGPDAVWNGMEVVRPGEFIHIILKIPVGTATASQVIRGTCTIEGYFE